MRQKCNISPIISLLFLQSHSAVVVWICPPALSPGPFSNQDLQTSPTTIPEMITSMMKIYQSMIIWTIPWPTQTRAMTLWTLRLWLAVDMWEVSPIHQKQRQRCHPGGMPHSPMSQLKRKMTKELWEEIWPFLERYLGRYCDIGWRGKSWGCSEGQYVKNWNQKSQQGKNICTSFRCSCKVRRKL